MEFLHLGNATNSITSFDLETKSTVLTPFYSSTLSPKDPNFSEWWAEHKSEWEKTSKPGQEPADD